MSKYKTIRFQTPKGERRLQFRPIDAQKGELICDIEGACMYKDWCSTAMRDPRDPDNPDLTFNDFCSSVGSEDNGNDEELYNMAPVDGTVEFNLPDFPDVIKAVINKDPLLRLSKIVECCKDSCDYYKPDLSGCTAKNKMCWIHGVLGSALKKKDEEESDD